MLYLLQFLSLLKFGFAGQLHAKFSERKNVYRGQHNRCMSLASFQLGKLLESKTGIRVSGSTDGKCNHSFVHVKTWVLASKIGGL